MIAGIDFSSRAVDVVLLDEDSDRAEWHRFELSGQDAFDRTRSVRTNVPRSAFWDHISAVGIEQPRGNHGIVHMARVQGAILAQIPADKLVCPLNPAEWRKRVGLAGNATKHDVANFVSTARLTSAFLARGLAATEPEPWPQDAMDAYCIALAVRGLVSRDEAA